MGCEGGGLVNEVAEVGRRRARPANRYGRYDSRPRDIRGLTPATGIESIIKRVGPARRATLQQLMAAGPTSLGELAMSAAPSQG
jgi:hypothetical protein